MSYYGEQSEFARALSDLYTIKVAKMMEKKGDFVPNSELGLYSNDAALESMRGLSKVDDVGAVLYKEAFGTASIGTIQDSVDKILGDGIFNQWLKNFENKNYEKCQNLLRKLH